MPIGMQLEVLPYRLNVDIATINILYDRLQQITEYRAREDALAIIEIYLRGCRKIAKA